MNDSMNLSSLQSDELLTFGQRFIAIFIAVKTTDDTYALRSFVNRASSAFIAFNKAFERESKNPFTKELSKKDVLRDDAFLAFRLYIEACSHRTIIGYKEAAVRILEIIRKHGWSAASSGYKVETAAIINITDEVLSTCTNELTLLAASDWLNDLVMAQEAFENVQKSSVTRPTTKEPTIQDTRPVLISTLKAIYSLVNLKFTDIPDSAELDAYVKAMNELILITQSTSRANITRNNNKKNKDDTTPGDK